MKITSVDAITVDEPVRSDVAIISAAGYHRESYYVVVAIQSDEGHTGFGEATVQAVWSGETQQSALFAIREDLAPHLIGQDPMHVTSLAGTMDRFLQVNSFTKAAVEMALLDLVGKKLGVPVYVLLGGARRPAEIRLRFSIGAFSPGRGCQSCACRDREGCAGCQSEGGTRSLHGHSASRRREIRRW